jgi:hypothetical protein
MSERQREHAKRYIQSLRIWKEKNIGEHACHQLAADTARVAFKLPDDEQTAVDAWLDERYPARRKPKSAESTAPSLFDDLPSVS